MHPTVIVFATGAHANHIRFNVLDLSLVESIHQRDMQKIRGTSDTKIHASGTITLPHLFINSCTCFRFRTVEELAMCVILGTTIINQSISSIHPVEKKFFPPHSPPVPNLTVHDAQYAFQKKEK